MFWSSCLDPRELNKWIKREHFHIPTLEDIQAKLAGSCFFTTLDCSQGYYQVRLSDKSSFFTTFNTPFEDLGISGCHLGFLQRRKSSRSVLAKYLRAYQVHGKTEEIHDHTLEMVLQKCRQENIKLNKAKCQVKKDKIKYLGQIISCKGLQPDPAKVEAIVKMAPPTDKPGIKRLLGLVNWHSRFKPNAADLTEPLRSLMKMDVEFSWQKSQEIAFQKIKATVTGSGVLRYYLRI